VPVLGAERLNIFVEFMGERITEIHGVEWFPTNGAANEIHRGHVVPRRMQKVLKFYGPFRADSPTIAATGTTGHIVKERPLLSIISVVKSGCRTILHTGQATVAFVINSKK
jgi:hypothetical protein